MDARRGVSEWIIRGLVVAVCLTLSMQSCRAMPVDANEIDRTRRSAASGNATAQESVGVSNQIKSKGVLLTCDQKLTLQSVWSHTRESKKR